MVIHMSNAEHVFTVSELNWQVKNLLEDEYSDIRIRGEISNLQTAQSGHMYFKLKDQSAEIDCALFRGTASRLRKLPETGLEVILTGQVTIYPNRGRYQFIVSGVEIGNEGELYKAFLERKRLLEEKGYFADDRKQQIPAFPGSVGVITSSSGAAVHDIIRAFRRRNPSIDLLVYHTAVQGDGAAEKIADAIDLANKRKTEQVLIVARGGGDIEDLWAFNELAVAEAIYRSELPIITGIGHETDFTIADFVADLRAATPTAAAERVSTPSLDEIIDQLANRKSRLSDLIDRKMNELSQEVDIAQKSLVHPAQRIQNQQSNFELLRNRLIHHTTELLNAYANRAASASQRLLASSPKSTVRLLGQQFGEIETLLRLSMSQRQNKLANQIQNLQARLESVNPESALNRGFSIIRRADDDSIVSSAGEMSVGDKLKAQLADGTIHGQVDSVDSEMN